MNCSQKKKPKERSVDQNFISMATIPFQVQKGDTHFSLLKDELSMRMFDFGEGKDFKQRKCIKMLKEYKTNKKYFRPLTNFYPYQDTLTSEDTE